MVKGIRPKLVPFSFAAVTVNVCPSVTVITSGVISTHTAGGGGSGDGDGDGGADGDGDGNGGDGDGNGGDGDGNGGDGDGVGSATVERGEKNTFTTITTWTYTWQSQILFCFVVPNFQLPLTSWKGHSTSNLVDCLQIWMKSEL